MNWWRQVAHVARKDLHLVRWLMPLYLVAVVLATAHALGAPTGLSYMGLSAVFVVLIALGMLILAFAIQADPPARNDAFWVTRPLSPGAVLGAKVLFSAVALVGVALVGQLVVLLSYDVPVRALPVLLVESAMGYGRWLAMAGLVAVLAPDLRSGVVAFLVLILVLGIGTLAVVGLTPPDPAVAGSRPPSQTPVALVWMAGALFIAADQYRNRRIRRGLVSGAVLVAVVIVLAPVVGARPVAPPHGVSGIAPDAAPRLQVIRVDTSPTSMAGGRLPVSVQIRLDSTVPGHSHGLVDLEAEVRFPDGTTVSAEVARPSTTLGPPALPSQPPLRWRGEQVDPRRSDHLTLWVRPDVHAAIRSGEATVTVQGRIAVLEPRLLGTAPFEPGGTVAAEGRRARITGLVHDPYETAVQIRLGAVSSSGSPPPRPWHFMGPLGYAGRSTLFAVVNEDRGEAIPLHMRSAGGGMPGLVLPGPAHRVDNLELQLAFPWLEDPQGPPDPEWLAASRLMMWELVPVGSVAVRLTIGERSAPLSE
jgi:hypothetical protein